MAIPVFRAEKKTLTTFQLMQRVAYISRETLYDELYHKVRSSHKAKSERIYQNVLLPEEAPNEYKSVKDWNDKKNIQRIWNDVNRTGYKRTARSYIGALPHEATMEQNIELVENFVQEAFVSHGYIVQYDIHNEKTVKKKSQGQPDENETGNRNYHVHILVSDMPCRHDKLIKARMGNGKSKTIYLDEDGNKIEMIETPKLKKGKLQYDKNNNIVMTMGYKKMIKDKNGKPILDEEGKPILKDIRVVTGESKNKKGDKTYIKTTYKRLSIKTNPMDEVKNYDDEKQKWFDVNYQPIRKLWEQHHNKLITDHDIRNENNELAVINMSSYKEQDQGQAKELQRIPQKNVYDRTKNPETVEKNKKITEHNNRVMAIRKAQETQIKFDAEADEVELRQAQEAASIKNLDPKNAWVNTWLTQAAALKDEVKNVFKRADKVIKQTMDDGSKEYHTLQDSPENNIEKERIARHWNLMKSLSGKIQSSKLTNLEDIKESAEMAWEKLPDQLKVAFVKKQFGINNAIIYSQVLARKQNNIDIVDGIKMKPPSYPSERTNQSIIRNNAKNMTGSDDIKKFEDTVFKNWNRQKFEAPPKEIIKLLNLYATLDKFYITKLTGQTWNEQNVISKTDYNPAAIEKTANDKLTALKAQQARLAEMERQAKEKAESEKAAAEKAKAEAEQVRQAELKKQEEERQAEESRIDIQINWKKYLQEFKQAVTNKDQNSINELSAKILDAFGNKNIQVKYRLACHERDQEHETMLHKYAHLHRDEEYDRLRKLKRNQGRYISDEEAEYSLENQFFTKNNKINARKLNVAIQEHNQNVKYESDIIETKKYHEHAFLANFWYSMLHPEQAIRQSKDNTATPALGQGLEISMPVEIQYAPDKKQNRPAPGKQTIPTGTTDGHGTNVLPNDLGKDVNLKGGWKEKDDDHEKSVMEITEEEMYKNWDPGKGL